MVTTRQDAAPAFWYSIADPCIPAVLDFALCLIEESRPGRDHHRARGASPRCWLRVGWPIVIRAATVRQCYCCMAARSRVCVAQRDSAIE